MSAPTEPALVGVIRWAGNAMTLLARHAAGEDGRCPECSAGGTGSGHVVGPCNVYLAAKAALQPPQQEG